MKAKKGEVAKAMAEADLNIGRLAVKARISAITASRVRNGREVQRGSALQVCQALGKTLEELFVDDAPAEGQAA